MTTPLDDDLDLAIQAGSPRLGGQHQHGRGVAPDVARWAPNRALLAAQPADGGCSYELFRLGKLRSLCAECHNALNNPRAPVRADGTPTDSRHPWNAGS